MASGEYFIRMGKSIAGPAKREKIEALWNAGKLAETAEVSPDKIHWETVKVFLEGKLADSVVIIQEDGEPDILTHQEQSPGAFLEAIRKRSVYEGLRITIFVSTVVSIMGIVITVAAFFIMGLTSGNGLLALLGAVVGVLGIFLVVASRQASLLLVDIADTLIEQNRKKGRNPQR